MKPNSITSPLARVAFVLLSAMWTATGWYLFLTQTFSTSPIRSKSSTTVTGHDVQFLGLVFVALGLIAMAIVLRSLAISRPAQAAALLTVLVLAPLVMRAALGMG